MSDGTDESGTATGRGRHVDGAGYVRPTRAVAWTLLPIAIGLPVLSAAFWRIAVVTESPAPDGLWHQLWTAFDIGDELTVAAWYSSVVWLLLGLCAVLAAVLAPRYRPSWWLFAVVSFVAAADETAALHERLIYVGDRLRPYVPFEPHYSWIIPGAAIAVVVVVLLIRVVWALRPAITLTLVIAGAVFLTGGLVIETWSGFVQRDAGGEFTGFYMVLSHIEEAFELVGVSLAIVALASTFWIRRESGALSVRFAGYRTPASTAAPGAVSTPES